jgi:hypothetical protein
MRLNCTHIFYEMYIFVDYTLIVALVIIFVHLSSKGHLLYYIVYLKRFMVQYLHHINMDITPQNIVCIVDFDLATQLNLVYYKNREEEWSIVLEIQGDRELC